MPESYIGYERVHRSEAGGVTVVKTPPFATHYRRKGTRLHLYRDGSNSKPIPEEWHEVGTVEVWGYINDQGAGEWQINPFQG